MRRLILLSLALTMCLCFGQAGEALSTDCKVMVRPTSGQARVVCLQVVGDGIIRVRATTANVLPDKRESLIIVPQTANPKCHISETNGTVSVKTARMQAVVSKQTGEVTFKDAKGETLLHESSGGKRFWSYRVPDREIGVDINNVPESQRNGLSWQLVFDSPDDEAFYGLGQHQAHELNTVP